MILDFSVSIESIASPLEKLLGIRVSFTSTNNWKSRKLLRKFYHALGQTDLSQPPILLLAVLFFSYRPIFNLLSPLLLGLRVVEDDLLIEAVLGFAERRIVDS